MEIREASDTEQERRGDDTQIDTDFLALSLLFEGLYLQRIRCCELLCDAYST